MILTQVAESVSKEMLIRATGLIDPSSAGQVKQLQKAETAHAAGKALKVQALTLWDTASLPPTAAERSAAALRFMAAVNKFHVVVQTTQGLGA